MHYAQEREAQDEKEAQDKKGFLQRKYYILAEGVARGIEKEIAEDYHMKEDNEAFLYDLVETKVEDFERAYLWMCKEMNRKPTKSLLCFLWAI